MWGADDPCDRMPMVWPDLDYEDQAAHPLGRERAADPVLFDQDLSRFYSSLWRMRSEHSILQEGKVEMLAADDDAGMLALRRFSPSSAMCIVFNRGQEPHELVLPVADGVQLAEIFTASGNSTHVKLTPVEGGVRVRLPGLEAVVLRESRQSILVGSK